jgi:hypothetical protein
MRTLNTTVMRRLVKIFEHCIAYLIVLFVATMSFVRCHFGVDTTDEAQEKIKAIDDGRSTVLFLYGFPAGYLFSNLRPETRMLHLHKRAY